MLNCPGVDLFVDQGRPAPTEPDAAVVLEQPAHGDRKTSGIIGAVVARDRDAIRHNYQPRQFRSSQLRYNRMAIKIPD